MMEDCTKCEDTELNNATPASCSVNQTSSDAKPSVDNKNTQIRVVRGAKKLKIDNNESTNVEKKGLLINTIRGKYIDLLINHTIFNYITFFKI